MHPNCSHLMFPQFMDDENPEERELAIFMDIVLIGKCSEVWVLGNTISSGMAREIEVAKKNADKRSDILVRSMRRSKAYENRCGQQPDGQEMEKQRYLVGRIFVPV